MHMNEELKHLLKAALYAFGTVLAIFLLVGLALWAGD